MIAEAAIRKLESPLLFSRSGFPDGSERFKAVEIATFEWRLRRYKQTFFVQRDALSGNMVGRKCVMALGFSKI